ncbi:MAG: Xaa-Pro peptidase family protein [Candidatus Verstraetearchaeota archaeon]|nr:Xaa-Pro peptidase family protein [Candidatus Verstraetearchaeota archaeon]
MDHRRRINELVSGIEGMGLDGAIIFGPENIHYLTGAPFVRGSYGKLLFVNKDGEASLIVSDLDYQEVSDTVNSAEIVKTDFMEKPLDRLRKIVKDSPRLGFEDGVISAALKEKIAGEFKLEPLRGLVERMRERKDAEEIAVIEKAQSINDRALEKAINNMKEGMSELEIAAELEYYLRKEGEESFAFETIVASGPRGVYPHGMPSTRKPSKGDSVVIDFGAKYGGYCSDMTRTLFFGNPDADARRAYEAVREAQEKAIENVSDGVSGKEVDAVARGILDRLGLGKYFVHGLGHGVGIEIHEAPVVGPSNENPLVPGNVITIEPGAYIPGRFGIRIEDLLVVEKGGKRDLTKFPRDLLVI